MGESELLCPVFFNDTATTEIYTLSLHDALPISSRIAETRNGMRQPQSLNASSPTAVLVARITSSAARRPNEAEDWIQPVAAPRSEEHTSELQSRQYLVCRLLLEKKKSLLSALLF